MGPKKVIRVKKVSACFFLLAYKDTLSFYSGSSAKGF